MQAKHGLYCGQGRVDMSGPSNAALVMIVDTAAEPKILSCVRFLNFLGAAKHATLK